MGFILSVFIVWDSGGATYNSPISCISPIREDTANWSPDMKAVGKLNAPIQRFTDVSFGSDSPAAVQQWVESLPADAPAGNARLLHEAVTEVNQLRCTFEQRFALLEALRPAITEVSDSLWGVCLKGPCALSPSAQELADLAQALGGQLSAGYKIVFTDGMDTTEVHGFGRTLVTALHRAMDCLSRAMLRSCQRYSEISGETWTELHQLYLLAEERALIAEEVEAPDNEFAEISTIRNAYLRALLLGCCDANGLCPQQMARLFSALELWVSYSVIGPLEDDAMFLIDFGAGPPKYQVSNPRADADLELFGGLYTSVLVELLEAHLEDPTAEEIPVPEFVSPDLIRHVVDRWGSVTQRALTRAPASGVLRVCIGFSATHYHVAGEIDFATLLGDEAENMLDRLTANMDDDHDPWAKAYEVEVDAEQFSTLHEFDEGIPVAAPGPEDLYPSYSTDVIDAEPRGYRVRWSVDMPADLQVGELLAIREEDAQEWSMARVGWFRNSESDGFIMGVDLLAPGAVAVALQGIRKKGGPTGYLRAFLLPELVAIKQPAMLITPRLPFRERHKVQIRQNDDMRVGQLIKRVNGTESFSQFQFRLIEAAFVPPDAGAAAEEDHDEGDDEDLRPIDY